MRNAYYLLARKYHPDKWNEEISNISKKESEEKFKSISNAFEDLKLANCLAWKKKKPAYTVNSIGNFHQKKYKKEIVRAFVFLPNIELLRPLVV